MSSDGQTRFIRIHGRVVPIRGGSSAESAKKAAIDHAKKAGAKVASATKDQAIEQGIKMANDSYNHDLTPGQQGAAKKLFSITEKIAAAGGVAAGAKVAIDAAHGATSDYARQARAARTKYLGIAAAGGVAAGTGAALAIAKKSSPLFNGALTAAGLTAEVLGTVGAMRAHGHVNRAKKLHNITSSLKKYSGG